MITFYSCEKEIELDFNDENQSLAVYSLFSPNDIFTGNSFQVQVSSTQSILDDSESQYLEDATVTITSEQMGESTQSISERLSFHKDGSNQIAYRTDNILPQDGYTYELKVEHENFPTVIAKSFVPAVTEIEVELSAFKKSKENQAPDFTRYFTKASIDIEDNFNTQNHYHLLVWLFYPGIGWYSVHIEEDVLTDQLGADATIINVENSPVFFGAHFNDKEFNGQKKELNFDIAFSIHEEDFPTEIKVQLRSVSEDYHRYFVEGFRQSQAGNNPFFVQTNNISNNIENGYGVFAGYSSYDVEIPFRK